VAGNTDNPRIWVNADAYVADVGTTRPTNVVDAWPAGWEALGLLSEDGMTESRDQEQTDHYAHGGILVRTTKSKHKRTMVVTALEDNPVVFGLVNPGSVPDTIGDVTTRTIVVPSQPDKRAFGLHLIDGDVIKRRVIPTGEVTEVGEVTIADDELVLFELTITVYPDATGILYYDITNDPQAVESS
jgi:hypothetical protein